MLANEMNVITHYLYRNDCWTCYNKKTVWKLSVRVYFDQGLWWLHT